MLQLKNCFVVNNYIHISRIHKKNHKKEQKKKRKQ